MTARALSVNDLRDLQILLIEQADSVVTLIPSFPDALPLNVYPNPAVNQVYYTLPDGVFSRDLSWEIFDLTGKKIRWGKQPSPHSIALQGLDPGSYFLKITTRIIIHV